MTREECTNVERHILHLKEMRKGIKELAEGGPFPVGAELSEVLNGGVCLLRGIV
jgi:hypothetical protein